MQGEAAKRTAALLASQTLPDLVAAGVFGAAWRVEAVESKPIGGLGQDHWASTTLTVDLQLVNTDTSEKRMVALVAKCMLPGDGFEGFSHTDIQASNEVAMYNKVFPLFEQLADGTGVSVADLYPKSYLTEINKDGLLSLTLMENLHSKGFSLSKERLELDMEHAKLVLRGLGRLHAFSHAAKARRREEFFDGLVPLLSEACYTDSHRPKMSVMMQFPFRRGLDRLASRLRASPEAAAASGLSRLQALANDVYGIMQRTAVVREPAGVILHGDFCRNNMQFRYDAAGRPAAVCFFDFQNSRYASPTVDLSLFLLLNTSAEAREAHWDALLQDYWHSLQDALGKLLEGHPVHRDFVRPTWQGLLDDLKRNALWGYAICSFFLPQMMVPPEDMLALEEIKTITADDIAQPDFGELMKIGGEKATDALADMLQFLIDKDLVPSESDILS